MKLPRFHRRLRSALTVLAVFDCCWAVKAQVVSTDSFLVHFADPTVFQYRDTFYLYGTAEGFSNNGFLAYYSTDLTAWKLIGRQDGYVLKKGDAFGTAGFWAPQVFGFANKFYMAYVANENIAIAEASSPGGPFKQVAMHPLAAEVKQIDPFVFFDDDGKKYLYHVRLTNGNKIFVAELSDDFTSIKTETLHECISASEGWENTTATSWPVTEGPSVLKHKGVYYLFYSANDFRNADYAVGYATSHHPLGPWKKFDGNPVISRQLLGINGTGHGDFFKFKGQYYYVLHTHNSNGNVRPRNTAIIQTRFSRVRKDVDSVSFIRSSFYFLHR